jgi:DNA-directed RNA polymerase specialized sigma subunit
MKFYVTSNSVKRYILVIHAQTKAMKKKVVICGVDTGSLPCLSAKESQEMMAKVKAGDKEARSRFILCNIRLVLSVLQRYAPKVSNPDDIFQIGCVGLVKSVDNFDNTLGVDFPHMQSL